LLGSLLGTPEGSPDGSPDGRLLGTIDGKCVTESLQARVCCTLPKLLGTQVRPLSSSWKVNSTCNPPVNPHSSQAIASTAPTGSDEEESHRPVDRSEYTPSGILWIARDVADAATLAAEDDEAGSHHGSPYDRRARGFPASYTYHEAALKPVAGSCP